MNRQTTLCLMALTTTLFSATAVGGDTPMEFRSVLLSQDTRGVTYPAVLVDGKPINPYAYLIHGGNHDRNFAIMAKAGIRCYTTAAALGNGPDGFTTDGLGNAFDEILAHAPDALIFPRVGVTPPDWWHKRNPGNRVIFDDGTEGPQSMFSEAWLKDACQWIEDYSRYLRTGPYAKNIMGIHICSGETAEWQSWGLWANKRGDFSQPAQRAWHKYLADKYGDDTSLATVWGREVRLRDAPIPTNARRTATSGLLRDPAQWQDVIDFYDFYWRGTAHAIEELAAAAKRGGGRDWLVGFFHGYAIQYGGKAQESQHLGMGQLLDCPDIDFFCSPAMYSNRGPGGTSTFMSYTESVKLAGKLWWDEADNRTHLSLGDPFSAVAPAQNLFESVGVLKREFAHAFTRKSAIWWFDMGGGWYDDPTLLKLQRDMQALGTNDTPRWEPRVDIAFFVDDKSDYRMRPDTPYLAHMTELMADMPRLGAPYHTYLLRDLPKAPAYGVYVFPNAFDLTDGERAAINALKKNGNILVFMGPAGIGRIRKGRVQSDLKHSEALIGFSHEPDSINTHAANGWYGVWLPTPQIAIADLRALLVKAAEANAGPVHFFHREDDALYAGNGLIALHAQQGGEKTITFRRPMRVLEVLTENGLEASGTTLTFPLKAKETRCFVVSPL